MVSIWQDCFLSSVLIFMTRLRSKCAGNPKSFPMPIHGFHSKRKVVFFAHAVFAKRPKREKFSYSFEFRGEDMGLVMNSFKIN